MLNGAKGGAFGFSLSSSEMGFFSAQAACRFLCVARWSGSNHQTLWFSMGALICTLAALGASERAVRLCWERTFKDYDVLISR